MFYKLFVFFALVSNVCSLNISDCDGCVSLVSDIQKQNDTLNKIDKICKLLNFSKCEDIIGSLENSTAIEICQELNYCTKYNLDNIIMLLDGTIYGRISGPCSKDAGLYCFTNLGGFNIDTKSVCPYTNFHTSIALIKDKNKLKVVYDSNSIDKHCNPCDNNGKYNISVIWEVEFDSDDWEFYNYNKTNNLIPNPSMFAPFPYGDGNILNYYPYPYYYPYFDYYYPSDTPYCSKDVNNMMLYNNNLMIVQSNKYRYYINPNGSIFKKFEMDKIESTYIYAYNYGLGYILSPPWSMSTGPFGVHNNYTLLDPRFNNGTIMFSKNHVYLNKYIVHDAVINDQTLCKVVDIDIQKIYSFKNIHI